MSFRRFVRSLLTACIVALPLLAAPGVARAAHDQLSIGISQFPANFNPLIDALAAKSYVLGMTMRPFTVDDKDWKLVCLLCTELPTFENGKAKIEDIGNGRKGIAATYTIQPGATWGDGVPVTTDDVKFTWNVGRSPSSGVTSAELFRRITAIDVKDAKTFTLHFDRVTFDYNGINDFQLLPAHLEAAAFSDPSQYRNRTLYETDTTNPGLYFGPYKITQMVRGQYVVLDQNPTWWGKPPAFKRIVVKAIELTPSLTAALLAGSIDMVSGEVGMSMDAAQAFETRHRPEWTVTYKPGLSYEHINVNLDNPILADIRVRQALLYGLDRASMMQQIYQGKQKVADGMVNPLDWMFDADVKKYPFDMAKAESLLDAAGWHKGADGRRRNDKGQTLDFDLMTTAGNYNREVMELVIQQAWKRLGIQVTLRNQPARTFFGETVMKHAFRDLAMFAWISAPENVPLTELRSNMVPSADNNYAGQNSGGYRSPQMDKLIDAIEVELDRDKRRDLWRQLQELYAEDLPDLPLTFRADPYILPVWLKGVEPTGHEYPTTLWIENWRAED